MIAAQRPEMRFVEPKTEDQQAKVVLFRARERLVHQRTELVNALRAVLYELGHIIAKGISQVKRVHALLADEACSLPALVCEECLDLMEQIEEKTVRIDVKTQKARQQAEQTDTSHRLQTMPDIGPMTVLAVESFAPDMRSFWCDRDFAAWLGLVPRQFSSGGRERLGRVSKAGKADIWRLLIIGAMSRLNWLGRKSIEQDTWLARLYARMPKKLVAIALANKMARQIWAMMTRQEDYQEPVLKAT